MCNCCCQRRKSIIIFMLVISVISFFYGIENISNFASNTTPYKSLKIIIDDYEKEGFTFYPNSYDIIKRLKGIEQGIGILLFIFTLIFIGVEIMLLYFSCGDKEYKLLSAKKFNIINIILIICIVASGISIILSILFSYLITRAFLQYSDFILYIEKNFFKSETFFTGDRCSFCLVMGFLYGYYQNFHFIVLVVGFPILRNKFKNMGYEGNPGPAELFDINGNRVIYPQNMLNNQGQPPIQILVSNNGNNAPETKENMQTPQTQNQNN